MLSLAHQWVLLTNLTKSHLILTQAAVRVRKEWDSQSYTLPIPEHSMQSTLHCAPQPVHTQYPPLSMSEPHWVVPLDLIRHCHLSFEDNRLLISVGSFPSLPSSSTPVVVGSVTAGLPGTMDTTFSHPLCQDGRIKSRVVSPGIAWPGMPEPVILSQTLPAH